MNIIILGSLGFYKNMIGQRQYFLAKELVKNHNVLFIETHDSGIKEHDGLKIDCFLKGDWLHNSYDVSYMQKKLDNILSAFINPKDKSGVIFEIPLSGYINCIPVFIKHHCKIHYDCIDNWRYFYGGNMIDTDRTKELIKQAHSISVTADYLKEDLKLRFDLINVPLISNAYAELENDVCKNDLTVNKDKINIFYVGSIGEWYDHKTVTKIVNNDNIEFHCFGNYTPRPEFTKDEFNALFRDRNNCHFYGPIKRNEIKSMISNMDYGIIPFTNIPLIYATDAVKAYEMTACYKKILYPVYMHEMHKFPDTVKIPYKDDFDFSKLPKNYYINKKVIDNFIKHNTWEIRVKKLLEVFNAI
jgi:hypothetical protein